MFKKKPLFLTFEGVEGSGKSYQSLKLYKNLKKLNISTIHTREPGGTFGAERIRKLILDDYFSKNPREKFDEYTDTLLYLAARNEHVKNKILPAINKKKIVICDRFVDSTLAYQVFGKNVSLKLINTIHNQILKKLKPDLTFILKVNISKALKRINKRKTKNRYDKFSRSFYSKVQKAFIKIASKNKKKYVILNNTKDNADNEKIILNKVVSILKK